MLHREDPDLFREAVQFTAGEMSLSPDLVEKDYFCSVVLAGLARRSPPLTFKGGTALAKVHVGFYRMSEDLDFSIPMPEDAPRSARSRAAAPLRQVLEDVAHSSGIHLTAPFTGSNNSRQYGASLEYRSQISGRSQTIRFEVGLREPILTPPEARLVQTMLRHPISHVGAVKTFVIQTLSLREAVAEKFRAALTRREPAIRDFYDIDVLVERVHFAVQDERFLDLLRAKLRTPGTGPISLSEATLAILRAQVPFDLLPMLRGGDPGDFALERSFELARSVADRL